MGSNTPFISIAILMNGFPIEIQDSFISAITIASKAMFIPTDTTIDFFDAVVTQEEYPDPEKYDLIVLGGGTADPMGSDPWVLSLQDFLRTTVDCYPAQKIVGLGWGHQAICVAFGGATGYMAAAEIGVTRTDWNEEGRKMFPGSIKLYLHEFHRREIKYPAKGFVPLAEGNKAFINATNTILTFQGHPELNADSAKWLWATNPPYMEISEEQQAALASSTYLDSVHHGIWIWRRILTWVGE